MAQPNGFDKFSMEQIMAFAASPAGKKLFSMIQNSGTDLSKAQSYASGGDLEQAKKELSTLLSDPQIRELLQMFGG